MNAPTVDIKDMIVMATLGTFATDLFIGKLPISPDYCIVLRDTGGLEPTNPTATLVFDRPSVQMIVRGAPGSYNTTWDSIKALRDAVLGNTNSTVNSTKYIGVWAQSDILFIGFDDDDRPMFSVNFRINRSE